MPANVPEHAPPLPAPPRRVRARAAFATWWPLGAAAIAALLVLLAIAGVRLADDGFRLPRADARLDAAPALGSALAEVTAVGSDTTATIAVEFRFVLADGRTIADRGHVPPGAVPRPRVGGRLGIEFLPDEPQVNRPVGGVSAASTIWLPDFLGRALLPAVAALLLWLARAWRTFVLLRHGVAAPARVVAMQRLPLLPFAIAEYVVEDENTVDGSAQRTARQLVRASTEDDARAERWCAIHAEDRPRSSRLVRPGDVAPAEA